MHLVAAAALVASSALGLSDALTLRWDAPPQCPNAAEVRAAFGHHAKPGPEPVDARGRIVPDDAGYVLTLELRNAAGQETRVIEAPSCDALAETAGLLIAVASEPALVPQPVPAPPLPPVSGADVEAPAEPRSVPAQTEDTQPPTDVSPKVSPKVSTGPTDTPPQGDGRDGKLGLVLALDGQLQVLRLLPQVVGGGVSASFALRGAAWRAGVRAGYTAPQAHDYPDLEVGGSFDLWTAGAFGCWEPHRGRLSAPLCGGFEAGSLRGQTQAVDEPGRGGAFFAGLTADATVVFAPIPRLALRAGVGGVVSARRPRFHVRDQDTLFQAGPGALRASLGVELRFR